MKSVDVFKPEDFTYGKAGNNATEFAERCNRLLAERAVKVYGRGNEHKSFVTYPKSMLHWEPTHTALLLNIQPIIKDTAESLLRGFVSLSSPARMGLSVREDFENLVDRARKLLDQKQTDGKD